MDVIYEPKGAAGEYSPLAANLYRGCTCGCRYCYAPATVRMSREAFARPAPRKDVLKALEKDAGKFAGTALPVLLSFTSDPYQPLEFEPGPGGLTRRAIEILDAASIPVKILTKRPLAALDRDANVFLAAGVDFGVSLVWTAESDRKHWEPGAESVADRIVALRLAHGWRLKTWVSLEPVIDPAQAIGVVMATAAFVDCFKVGKLNHDRRRESQIDWREFLFQILRELTDCGAGYRIKDSLWTHADREIRDRWPKEKETDQHSTEQQGTSKPER